MNATPFARRSHEALVPLAILGAFFTLAALTLGRQDFWMDEFYALVYIDRPFTEALRVIIRPEHNGPLYFLLLWAWRHLVGTSEYALRYLSLLWMVIGLAATWRLGRDLAPARVAHAGALLLACAPMTLYYAQEAKMYALFMALGVLSSLSLWRALQRNRWRDWLRYVILFNLLGYSHYFGAFTIAVQGLLVLLTAWKRPRVLRAYAITMLLAMLPYIPVALFLIRAFPGLGVPEGLQNFLPLPQMLTELLTIYGPRLGVGHVRFGPYLPLGLAFLTLLALFLAYRQRPRAAVWVALLTWLPALLYYPISYRLPLFTARYFITGLPFFALTLAWLVMFRARVLRALALSALLLLYAWADLRDLTHPIAQRPRWRALSACLAPLTTAQDVIIVHNWFAAPLVAHYYQGAAAVRECPPDACSAYAPELFFQSLADEGVRVAWLVLYQDQALTPRHQMTQRLATRWPTLLPLTDLHADLKVAAFLLNPSPAISIDGDAGQAALLACMAKAGR